ncbi:MAG: hypothetical protein ACI4KR_13050 [Ruminiclostridium sp.]
MKELLETGVNIGLSYDKRLDGLMGQIKGYSVVVKENNQTGSYGCLLWVRKGDYAAIKSAEDYLAEQVTSNPELVKNFRVTERGIAAALVKTSDSFKNITNIKRFLYDLTSFLSLNFYVSCCYDCGKTAELSIYSAEGVPVQCCGACGEKYEFISAPQSDIDSLFPAAEPIKEEKISFDNLLAEEKTEKQPEPVAEKTGVAAAVLTKEEESQLFFKEIPAPEAEPAPKREEVKASEDKTDISGLMFGAFEEKKPEPPKSEIFEQAQREFELQKQKEAQEKQNAQDEEEFSLKELMVSDLREANNGGEDLTIPGTDPEDKVGHSEEISVTEIYDDSNEGEDIDVTEIESTVSKPTVTTGHRQLSAMETPLDKDGNVPLMNPNAVDKSNIPSAVDGPDAVAPSTYTKPMPTAEHSATPPPGYAIAADDPRSESAPTAKATPYTGQTSSFMYLPQDSNALSGILGAFVLAVLGVAVWVLIAQMGFLSYIGSLAIIGAVFGGYRLAGGSMDRKGIAISAVISVVMNVLGFGITLVIEVQKVIHDCFGYSISFFDAIDWVAFSLTESGASVSLLIDMGVSMLFMIVGLVGIVTNLLKKT